MKQTWADERRTHDEQMRKAYHVRKRDLLLDVAICTSPLWLMWGGFFAFLLIKEAVS